MKNNYQSRTYIAAVIVIGLLLLFSIKSLSAATPLPYSYFQEIEISGTITDKDDLPVPGATVSIKDSNNGTLTDMEGNYQLTVPVSATLVISYLGFKSKEVTVDGQEEIDIQLEEDVQALGAVEINAGYYNTTERERTGNISRVSGEEIELQPVVSPLQALQGRVAGLEVVEQNGVPGAAPTIKIRGQNSLRNSRNDNGNFPLYIIDGVPVNSSPVNSINQSLAVTGTDPLNGLNVSNIESIEVLKDADATAIYGSRGANGVILITTKRGSFHGKKDNLEARFYTGISRVSHFVDLLETPEYLALRRQAFENDGVEPTDADAKDLLLWDQERNTDWQEVLYGNAAPTLNANINYSGGGGNTSFSVGASYFEQGSVFPGNSSFEKITTNLNLNHQSANERFRLTLSVNYGINNNNQFSSNDFVSTALNLPPNAPELYQEDGSLNWEDSTWDNPLAALESKGKSNLDNLVANAGLQYKLFEGLTAKVNLGYTYLNSEENILIPREVYDPAIWNRIDNRSQHSFINRKSWIAEPQLVYNNNFGKHTIDALIGATFQQNNDASLRIIGTGYANTHLIGNLEAADAISNSTDRDLVYKYNAVFARIGYNWDHTYLINLTGRRDGSSRFGPDNRFSNFGAIGASWIFSDNKFFAEHLPFISFGKLRGSYGITGNDQIGDYRYMDTYEPTPGPGGLYPTQLTNPSFSWESNKKIEAALEMGLLQDRINFNLSWYRNRSSNQLVGYNLPAITGFNSVEANLPATVQNTGLEIALSTQNIKSEDFQWQTSFNLTIPNNELIEFENIEESSYANTYKIGKPLNLALLYEFNGIDPETGLYEVVDVNQDGSYDFNDRIVYRDMGRQFFGGINNQINYGNFSLGFLVEFVKQRGIKIYNSVPGFLANSFKNDQVLWTPENTTSEVQKSSQSISALISYLNANSSNFGVTDASFARLKTLSIGYSLPNKVLNNFPLSEAKIFVHGQNLFTISDYTGLDPQNPGNIALPVLQGITAGLQLKF